jgi:hypothetical protein
VFVIGTAIFHADDPSSAAKALRVRLELDGPENRGG